MIVFIIYEYVNIIHISIICIDDLLIGMWGRSRGARSDVLCEIWLVSRERDDILAKHLAVFT